MRTKEFLIFLIASCIIFLPFFSLKIVASQDFPFSSPEAVKDSLGFPTTWYQGGGLGYYNNMTLWYWPFDFMFSVLATLNISFAVIERLLGIFLFWILGTYSIFQLLNKFIKDSRAKLVGGIVYLFNTYILLLIDGGQISIALAYSIFPLAYLYFLEVIEDFNTRKFFKSLLAISALSVFDIRFIYILLALLALRIFPELIQRKFNKHLVLCLIKVGAFTSVFLVCFHAYWLIQPFLVKSISLPATYERTSQVSSLSFTDLGHAIFLQQPHWYKNVFGKISPLQVEFLLLPLLVILTPILKRRNATVGFWLFVWAMSVFFAKGNQPPFPEIYEWFFVYIPGFSLFRDSTKFFFLVALSASILVSITVEEICKLNFSRLWLKKVVMMMPFLVVGYLVFLARPTYLNQMTGMFSSPIYADRYNEIGLTIRKQDGFFRTLWIPKIPPLGFKSPQHPILDAFQLSQLRPFIIGTVGNYETLNFLRESSIVGELLDIVGVKYIFYPYPDLRRENLSPQEVDYYHLFWGQLSKLPWIGNAATDSAVPILMTKKQQDRFFTIKNTWWVVGSDHLYTDLANIPKFVLSSNALIFAEEYPALLQKIDQVPLSRILLYNKDEMDLVAALLNENDFIYPSRELGFDPKENGWWKREAVDFLQWRNFLHQKYQLDNLDFDYQGGWSVAENNLELKLSGKTGSKGDVLLARVMESSKGGIIKFYEGDRLVGSVNTKINNPTEARLKLTGFGNIPDQYFTYEGTNFRWVKIGPLDRGEPLKVITEGQINVVNTLAIVPSTEWDNINNKVKDLMRSDRVLVWKDLSEGKKEKVFTETVKGEVSYKRINSTHYLVEVKNTNGPVTIAFSDSYDSLWQLNGKSSLPLYSLINGFTVPGDGEYDVVFMPQKYINPGLLVSGITLTAFFFIYFLLQKLNRKYN